MHLNAHDCHPNVTEQFIMSIVQPQALGHLSTLMYMYITGTVSQVSWSSLAGTLPQQPNITVGVEKVYS